MKDKGIVIATQADLAQVKVACLSACDECTARSLCLGHKHSQGLLAVKNSLQANPGDEVEIDVPGRSYNKALIILFGSLVVSAVGGMTAGYASAFLFPYSSSLGSFLGFFLGMGLGAAWILYHFRKNNLKNLYPKITDIIKKGDCHG